MSTMNRRTFLGLAAGALGSAALVACGGQQGTQASASSSSSSSSSSGASSSSEAGHISAAGTLTTPYDEGYSTGKHHATIKVKDFGTIKVELDADTAPITVSNFAHLANAGFYNGLTFHRIIKDFMVQGGDPNGDGSGGSDVNILGEFSANGKKNDIKHERGVISMARSQANNSASSQFFIVHKDSNHLDGQYAGFGHVTEGLDVVDKLAEVKAEEGTGSVAKKDQPVIESIAMDD